MVNKLKRSGVQCIYVRPSLMNLDLWCCVQASGGEFNGMKSSIRPALCQRNRRVVAVWEYFLAQMRPCDVVLHLNVGVFSSIVADQFAFSIWLSLTRVVSLQLSLYCSNTFINPGFNTTHHIWCSIHILITFYVIKKIISLPNMTIAHHWMCFWNGYTMSQSTEIQFTFLIIDNIIDNKSNSRLQP